MKQAFPFGNSMELISTVSEYTLRLQSAEEIAKVGTRKVLIFGQSSVRILVGTGYVLNWQEHLFIVEAEVPLLGNDDVVENQKITVLVVLRLELLLFLWCSAPRG